MQSDPSIVINMEDLEPAKVKKNPKLIEDLLTAWKLPEYIPSTGSVYTNHELPVRTFEAYYSFTGTIRNSVISSVTEIRNPYTKLLFELHKLDREDTPTIEQLYHGTHQQYVEKICQENLNYRYCGRSRGHKFGRGVSFSNCPFYSSHYCGVSGKQMFYCDVASSNKHLGDISTMVPLPGHDATINAKGSVLVKYHDDNFYPRYLIKF